MMKCTPAFLFEVVSETMSSALSLLHKPKQESRLVYQPELLWDDQQPDVSVICLTWTCAS